MTETLPSVGVDLFHVHRFRLTQVEAPRLSPEEALARDRAWNKMVRANPGLFDGAVVACGGLEWEGPHSLALSWAQVTYRHYTLRRIRVCNMLWVPSGRQSSWAPYRS